MEERLRGCSITRYTLGWKEGRYIGQLFVCCVCSYEKFSETLTNKEPVIINIEQKVTHA